MAREDVFFAMPAQARRVQDVAFEFDQAHRAEAQLPERARRMQQVEVRGEFRRGDGAGHREAIFQQRPVEGFAVEGDQDRAARQCARRVREAWNVLRRNRA